MNRRRAGFIMLVVGISFMCASFFLMVFGQSGYGGLRIAVSVTVFFLLIAAIVLAIVGEMLYRGRFDVNANVHKYNKLSYKEVTDYKATIEAVRQNYANDKDGYKNRLPKVLGRGYATLLDNSVAAYGTIHYGCIVEANNRLFSSPRAVYDPMLPAVVVYGVDPYFDEHPEKLAEIAKRLYADRMNNILKDERRYFTNLRVSPELCEGREVYMSTVMVFRAFLPLGYLSGNIFPVIAAPTRSSSVYIVDCKYWTEELACNYAFVGDIKKRRQKRMEEFAGVPKCENIDYAAELDGLFAKYRTMNEVESGKELEDTSEDDSPFGELGREREQFYYSYVVSVEKRLNSPFALISEFTVLALYGEDDCFKSDPYLLKAIAARMVADETYKQVKKTVIDEKSHSIARVALPQELSGGKEVYLTGVVVWRPFLPQFSITNNLMVIANHTKEYPEVFTVPDCKYWTDNLVSAFVHGTFVQPK